MVVTRAVFSLGMFSWMVLSLFMLLQQGIPVGGIYCEEYNDTANAVHTKPVARKVLCKNEIDFVCFALWYNASGKITVHKKGCWAEKKTPVNECIGRIIGHGNSTTFCSCHEDMCNVELKFGGFTPTRAPQLTTASGTHAKTKNNVHEALYILVAVICFLAVCIVLFLVYIKINPCSTQLLADNAKNRAAENLLTTKLPPIQLKDVLSQGQFCNVRKGTMGNIDVAVKIFPITHRNKSTPSAITEKDIYISCNLDHSNILKFIAAQSHEDGHQTQLWLVTEYLEKGSLCDFLKQNTITWDNLCHMAAGMAAGMAYLHAEIPKRKPSISHRDMKSKNVLVKSDLTCCISDFGLSLKFDSKESPGDTHGQVGTRRYMAPEVLEGAINFSREAFLRIDMYAFGLCLWELLSRCTAREGPVGEYKFPFEEEVGMHPSLEELQDSVVHKKIRPKFCPEWKNHVGLAGLVTTTDECWDHDADARLTADCVAERVKQLRTTVNSINQRQTSAPLSVSLNINSDSENVAAV